MKPWSLIAAIALFPAGEAAAAPQVAIVAGSGATTSFDALSPDGCVHSVGELVVVQAHIGGELADGVYVTGMQEDLCTGAGNGVAGYVAGNFPVLPLVFGHYDGTIEVPSYSGGAPMTLEVDLSWLGHGKVSREGGVFQDENQISFSFGGRREAYAVGDIVVDGVPATLTGTQLISEASGTITR